MDSVDFRFDKGKRDIAKLVLCVKDRLPSSRQKNGWFATSLSGPTWRRKKIRHRFLPGLLLWGAILFIASALHAEEIDYQYDAAGQLTRADYQGIAVEHYLYDSMGNRIALTIADGDSSANSLPDAPGNPQPADRAEGVLSGTALSWSGSDPDAGDILVYRVHFGEVDPPPLLRIQADSRVPSINGLKSYTTYYWQVIATDCLNQISAGPVWRFTTGNNPPNEPELVRPADMEQIPYLRILLKWAGPVLLEPNPNDGVVYDLYLGQTDPPEIFETDISSTRLIFNGLSRGIDTEAVYYWRVEAKDNHGARSSSRTRRFVFRDSDGDGLPDDLEDTMCTSASNADSDYDRIPDGMEDADHNGVRSDNETNPCNSDTDGDGMPDGWEQGYGTNPLIHDAQTHSDSDGIDNYTEYAEGTDPLDDTVYPGSRRIEDFETGDFSKFFWMTDPDTGWTITSTETFDGRYAARTGGIGDNQISELETIVLCDEGRISFFYRVSSEETDDRLVFYIDDVEQGQWSGNVPYARAAFPVAAGWHTFKWAYVKGAAGLSGQDAARIDNIVFPGPPDTDSDGAIDGWEMFYFGTLDQDLCGDANGDGVSDLAAALVLADPVGGDSDDDGLPDLWEAEHGVSDPWEDADGDGYTNYNEFIGHSDPGDVDTMPRGSVLEDFETGDLTRFYWRMAGNAPWQVSIDNPYLGVYSAQAPALGDGQSAAIETTIDGRQGFIGFYFAVSSEADGDYLRFYIDDALQGEWSGDVAYQFAAFPVTSGVHTLRWEFARNDAGTGLNDTAWIDHISFPGSADSDGDGVVDGWEITHFGSLDHDLCGDSDGDGISDLQAALVLADPIGGDSDGDGMADIYESTHRLNPNENDAWDDPDEDGYTNYDEFIGRTDPWDLDDIPRRVLEDFETGDLSKFYWVLGGDGFWQVTGDTPYKGVYGAQSPVLVDSQSAFMATTVNCLEGPVAFYYAVSSEDGGDWLRFYIDDQLKGEWSGELGYQFIQFHVPRGQHTFKWAYFKNGANVGLGGTAWVDHISFPGSADSDGDGVIDGWEFTHFGTLNQDLCGDSDGDGISDLQAALLLADPIGGDTDGDGMADIYEAAHGLNPNIDDAWSDADEDGFTNYDEFTGRTDPQNIDDTPRLVMEDFETGDLTKFYWIVGGDGAWRAGEDNPYQGKYSAQSPLLTDAQSAFMETTINCRQGFVGFRYSVGSQTGSDGLRFYIDGALQQEWSGDLTFQLAVFPVAAGPHTFRWEYAKDGAGLELEDAAWVDNISFPGSGDSDADGVIDGWEYFHFGVLNMDLCNDSDGDGHSDLEAALTLASPYTFDDADHDGLSDDMEESGCTKADDADSDDDGLVDGREDANRNGMLDVGETDPCNPDTDGDGIQDGTESGVTLTDIGPDTDRSVFVPDADPETVTNPTSVDSDDDWLLDGEEDLNGNGKADDGETSAELADSDDDNYLDGFEVISGADPLFQDWYLPITVNNPNEELLIQGTVSGRQNYFSTRGIVFKDATVAPDADVSTISTTETRLEPGTHLKSGSRVNIRVRQAETPISRKGILQE